MLRVQSFSRGVGGCFSRPVAGLLTRSYRRDRERFNHIFNQSAPQPKLAALDKDFREKAFQLVSGHKPFDEFSPEEIATADAFVSYDEEFREKAELLRQSKKPIEAYSLEEKRVMELYVNFDKEFREVVEEVTWRDYPIDDVDEIRTLYVNFHTKFKPHVDTLTEGLYYADSRKHHEREHFLCVNYHKGFQEKAQALINGAKEFDQMDSGEQTTLKNYINLNEKFKDRAEALIRGFRTVESLSDDEKRIIRLFVRLNLKYREDVLRGVSGPAFAFRSEQHIRSYNYALLFDTELREKTQQLMWGSRRFEYLLPGEQKMVHSYVNFSHSFKSDKAFEKDAFGNSFHRNGATYSWHFSKKVLRTYENYTACDEEFLREVKGLIFGDTKIAEFTDQESGMVQLYVHHNEEFQKQVNALFTKPFQQLSAMQKKIFSLNYKYDGRFQRRVDDLIESIKNTELFTPEERTLATLYVNCDSGFQKKVAKLLSTKKEFSAFSLEEERIAALYTNFDVNFQVEVRELIGEHHKKGGHYDFDQKLRYPTTDLSYLRSYNYLLRSGGRPKVELFEVEATPEPEIAAPPSQPCPMIDFTPQEEVKIKLYVHFHTDYHTTINELLRRDLPRTKEAKRIFRLGMWYDHDLRENVFSSIWDKTRVAKIIDGTYRDFFTSKEQALDAAQTMKSHMTDEDFTYWSLGFDYFKIRLNLR